MHVSNKVHISEINSSKTLDHAFSSNHVFIWDHWSNYYKLWSIMITLQ